MDRQLGAPPYAQMRGVPYLLSMQTPRGRKVIGSGLRDIPPYLELRSAAAYYIAQTLGLQAG